MGAVVLVAGNYLRGVFQNSSKRTIYEEIPDVGNFMDLTIAIKLAREHRDLRTEFQLYYCLMKVLRSTQLLLNNGGLEPEDYGIFRTDDPPPECKEPPRNAEDKTKESNRLLGTQDTMMLTVRLNALHCRTEMYARGS